MQENGSMSLLQAISIAGGTGVTASIKSVYVLRRNKDDTTTWFEFPYKKMTEGKFADAQLRLNDILFVPTNHFKAAFLSTSNVLASASSASIISAYRF
jgi:protein involved in polysaccharide export with SLBB domain